MADITKRQDHSLDPELLRSRLEELADEMKSKFGVKSEWDGNTCKLSGSALKRGTLEYTESEISLELTLGMMGNMIKGQIEKEIDARLAKILEV